MWQFDMHRLRRAFKLRNSKLCSLSSLIDIHIIFKRQAKALIRLRVYAGWSEPLLVAHTTLLEISCRGSNNIVYKDVIVGLGLLLPEYEDLGPELHCLLKVIFQDAKNNVLN